MTKLAIVLAAAALALGCGRDADMPENATTAPGKANEQPSLGSYGTGDDGTNGGMYDPGAVGAGVSAPTSGGSLAPPPPRRGARLDAGAP